MRIKFDRGLLISCSCPTLLVKGQAFPGVAVRPGSSNNNRVMERISGQTRETADILSWRILIIPAELSEELIFRYIHPLKGCQGLWPPSQAAVGRIGENKELFFRKTGLPPPVLSAVVISKYSNTCFEILSVFFRGSGLVRHDTHAGKAQKYCYRFRRAATSRGSVRKAARNRRTGGYHPGKKPLNPIRFFISSVTFREY